MYISLNGLCALPETDAAYHSGCPDRQTKVDLNLVWLYLLRKLSITITRTWPNNSVITSKLSFANKFFVIKQCALYKGNWVGEVKS